MSATLPTKIAAALNSARAELVSTYAMGDDDYDQIRDIFARHLTEATKTPKRHRWHRKNGWACCVDCGCRYQTGNVTRQYQHPDGSRDERAGECTQ